MATYFDEHSTDQATEAEASPASNAHFLDMARLVVQMPDMAELIENLFVSEDQRKPPPAAKAVLENLPTAVGHKPTDACPVCLKEFGEEAPKQLPCKHCFHLNCIRPWLTVVNTCPVCRHELKTDDAAYEAQKKRKADERSRKARLDELHINMYA